MKINKILSLVVCLCAFVLLTQSAMAQYKVKVTFSDMPSDSGIVTIGIHPNASYSIDGPLGFGPGDTVKEVGFPPAGPSNFDVRLVSIAFRDSLDNGSLASIHKMSRITQTDKWKITFQPESDSGIASPMNISWPAGLGSVGGGYWRLQDEFGGELANMVTTTSFTMPNSDPNAQTVFIVTGDSLGFLTAPSDSIALATNYLGKAGKFEKFGKAKPYQAEACFTLTVPDSADDVHLEFSMGLVEWQSFSQGSAPTITEVGKTSKFDKVFASRLYNPATVSFCVKGAKGKALTLKSYSWSRSAPGAIAKPVKLVGPAPTYSRLLLHMPNWVNVLEEMYLQLPGLAPNGISVGEMNAVAKTVKLKDIFRNVIHPKYGDLMKTLNAKGALHTAGPSCLNLFIGGKPIEKTQKALPPTKHSNKLLAELLAMKVNINSSLAGKTNTGFGGLYFDIMSGDITTPAFYKGMTVNGIAAFADSVLSCDTTKSLVDVAKLYDVILRINKSFNAAFDTSGFAVKTKLKNARVLATLNPPILYRTSVVALAPIENPNWTNVVLEPEVFKLEQNYPNPFNPTTTIEFNIPADAFVTLKIYNMLGQEVATLLDRESMSEGSDRVEFDANALSTGVYFYRIIAETVNEDGKLTNDTFTQVKKMMLLK